VEGIQKGCPLVPALRSAWDLSPISAGWLLGALRRQKGGTGAVDSDSVLFEETAKKKDGKCHVRGRPGARMGRGYREFAVGVGLPAAAMLRLPPP
jgi:hypothetical protein